MKLFHLFSLSVLALSFSGKPLLQRDAVLAELPVTTIVLNEREETEEFIPWIQDNRLTWDDFKCEPRRGTDAVASTSTSLGISYQVQGGVLTYHITCNFSKVKSWGLMKTDYILAHEQGHFDITEIYARKLNEALQNYVYNKKTFKKDINDIYQSIVKQKEDLQKKYDGESDHSRHRKLQYDWLNTIQEMLDETEEWAMYP